MPHGYGARIRALREEKGWSQTQLGNQAVDAHGKGLNKGTVNAAELERNPRMNTLERIAHALGLHSTAQLFDTVELESGETQATMGPTQEDDPLHSRRQSIIALVGSLVREEDLQLFEAAAQELMARRSGREQSGAGKRSNEGR